MAERMSVACYRELDGKKEIVGVNACPVKCIDDEEKDIVSKDSFLNYYSPIELKMIKHS